MKRDPKVSAFLALCLALSWALVPVLVSAKVRVLSKTTLLLEGKKVARQGGVLRHPVVTDLLAAFERAESALKKKDIDALMQFYAPSYDYHGLKEDDVRRVWSEVFKHYKAVESLHLFSDIKITQVNKVLRAEVTCTGGLYGTDERSGDRVTLDSWFQEVHYMMKEGDVWRFLGNAGEVPDAAPFASAPHHPLF